MKEDKIRSQPARAVSPSLVAAKNVNVNRDFLDDGERKVIMMKMKILKMTTILQVEQLRLERERELQEMRRMREQEMDMEEMQVRGCSYIT